MNIDYMKVFYSPDHHFKSKTFEAHSFLFKLFIITNNKLKSQFDWPGRDKHS